MTGLELMQKIRDGALPPAPIQRLLGMDLVEAEEGRTAFALTPREDMYNPLGTVHGGIAGTMLDSCMGAAVHTTLPEGGAYATLEISFNLVRPISVDTGRIVASGHVVHRGSRVATAAGEVRSERDGKLLAHGTSTCLIVL
ncbi:MAG: hypothetical protein QOH58_2640 [Thermoleophilaceae bacterium]|nr:hypothetical protein [Thermoleophilaceae bacterium]